MFVYRLNCLFYCMFDIRAYYFRMFETLFYLRFYRRSFYYFPVVHFTIFLEFPEDCAV